MKEDELRAAATMCGHMFTETEARLGDQMGQVIVGLHPEKANGRSVEEMIETLCPTSLFRPVKTSSLRLSGGPPTANPSA